MGQFSLPGSPVFTGTNRTDPADDDGRLRLDWAGTSTSTRWISIDGFDRTNFGRWLFGLRDFDGVILPKPVRPRSSLAVCRNLSWYGLIGQLVFGQSPSISILRRLCSVRDTQRSHPPVVCVHIRYRRCTEWMWVCGACHVPHRRKLSLCPFVIQ